jgi:hypothetical protein
MKKGNLKNTRYPVNFKKLRKPAVLFVMGLFILVMLSAFQLAPVQAKTFSWYHPEPIKLPVPVRSLMPISIPICTHAPTQESTHNPISTNPPTEWKTHYPIYYNPIVPPTSTPDPTPTTAPDPTTTPISDPPKTQDPTPSPTPTITPTPSPTPSPTPIPATPSPVPTPTLLQSPAPQSSPNLAPITDGLWHIDSSWNTAPADNFYYDSTTTHNGAPTWRAEPGSSLGVDHDWCPLTVKPGDHIVMTCWVKTLGTPDSAIGRSGATIGIDFYTGNYGGTWARIGGMNAPGDLSIEGNRDIGWAPDSASFVVPWGSNWVLRTYDFTVPKLWCGDGGLSNNQVPRGAYATPQYICPWLMVSANYGSTQGIYTTWFSDFQLHINP